MVGKRKWYAEIKWSTADVIAAAEEQGITLTEAQAARWWEDHECSFAEMIVQSGNEMLSLENFDSYKEDNEDEQ